MVIIDNTQYTFLIIRKDINSSFCITLRFIFSRVHTILQERRRCYNKLLQSVFDVSSLAESQWYVGRTTPQSGWHVLCISCLINLKLESNRGNFEKKRIILPLIVHFKHFLRVILLLENEPSLNNWPLLANFGLNWLLSLHKLLIFM